MGVISERWASLECRIEDGIFFADDTFVPLVENEPELPRIPVDQLLTEKPDWWWEVNLGEPLAQGQGHVLFGGGTSWEGAGFLALVRMEGNSLEWVLHSSRSEGFCSAELTDGVIRATSGDYPVVYHWTIPVPAPWTLQVIAERV